MYRLSLTLFTDYIVVGIANISFLFHSNHRVAKDDRYAHRETSANHGTVAIMHSSAKGNNGLFQEML